MYQWFASLNNNMISLDQIIKTAVFGVEMPKIYDKYWPYAMKLKWCDTLYSNGLGNRLAYYWQGRAMAFWFDLKFETDPQCSCNTKFHKKNGLMFCQMSESKFIWTQYLPSNVSLTFNYLLQNENNTIYDNISIKPDEREKYINFSLLYLSNYHYGHKFDGNAVINTLFLKIVQYEMNQAFQLYILQRHRNKLIMNEYNLLQKYLYNDNNNDKIVVHWRCGDILSGKTGSYGFNGLSYYVDALKLFNLNNNNNSNTSVYIMVNMNKHKARDRDSVFFDKCSKLLSLINDKLKNIFENVTKIYNVINDGTINTDHYLLSHATYVICGKSSFCEQVVIGNKNNIIMSNKPWSTNPNTPKYIQTLAMNNRFIHPRNVNSNLTIIANYIINH